MKTNPWRHIAAALLVAALALPASAAESLSVLLQKGIYAEETEGNLDSAIKIYEQIAAEAATNRAIVAQAQYRLAVCYQKQGRKELAIKVLNELLRQFPSEIDVTQKSRKLLAEFGGAPTDPVTIRKLAPLEVRWISRISPDGQFIAYVPADSSDIFVYETATGTKRMIAKRSAEDPVQDGAFSPDGRYVAYTLNYMKLSKNVQVWVARVDGSEARMLHERDRKKGSLWTLAWSPDSTRVIAASWEPSRFNDQTLVAIDAKTGESKEIARVSDFRSKGSWKLSWDGRYLALRGGADHQSLVVVELESRHEELLVDGDVEKVICWSPGDSKVIYATNRTGVRELWAIGVKDGKRTGPPEFLRAEVSIGDAGRITGLGYSRDGNRYDYLTDKRDGSAPWVVEGSLTSRAVQKLGTKRDPGIISVPAAEIAGPNHSIRDREFGVSAIMPSDWTVRSAGRFGDQENFVFFDAPDFPEARPGLYYRINLEPKEASAAAADSWLRQHAQEKAAQRVGEHFKDYKNRPASFVSHSVGGRPALSWSADYLGAKPGEKKDHHWTEYFTAIVSEKCLATFFVKSAAADIDAIRPKFDGMIKTLQLP